MIVLLSSAEMFNTGAQSARCEQCNALLGTTGISTPPHLPSCTFLHDQAVAMTHAPIDEDGLRGMQAIQNIFGEVQE